MKICLILFGLSAVLVSICSAKITIRTKRQIEREGNLNETTTVFTRDRESNIGTEYETVEPVDDKTDVMEVDFDPKDGTFAFGGKFPSFFNRNFHNHFDDLFRQMTKRFEDMSRNMFERFNSTTNQYPPNYNGTKEEVVTINGRQFRKKEHVIKKTGDNLNIFITSTSYEPMDDESNETESV
jgi:hypothetical protein